MAEDHHVEHAKAPRGRRHGEGRGEGRLPGGGRGEGARGAAKHAAKKKNVRHHPIVTITTGLLKILKADAEDDDPRISETENERRRMLMRDRIANIPTGKKRKAEEAGLLQ